MGLVLHSLVLLVVILFDPFLGYVLPLNILFQIRQLITVVERFEVLAELVLNAIMLRFFEHWNDRAIHDTLLHRLRIHILLIVFEVD